MREITSSFWRRHRWLTILACAFLGVLVVLGSALAIIAHHFEPFLRARLVGGLEERFRTQVELDTFHVSLGNGLEGEWGIWATGKGLRIWPPQHTGGDRPLVVATQSVPLISLDEFRFHVPLRYPPEKTVKISRVRLSGLRIVIPPKSQRDRATGIDAAMTGQKPSPAESIRQKSLPAETWQNPGPPNKEDQDNGAGILANVLVKRIDCDHAELILATDKPGKVPLSFAISRLRLTDVSAGGPMGFEADLTNPKPQGNIHTTGRLGPWLVSDPGETPMSGKYTFDHADLATFAGIAGILNSTGNYEGTLRDISVDGQANVPDFRLTHFGNAVPVHTQFHAKVDGTNGDTWLEPVDAMLGHSHFVTRGQVVRVRPSHPATPGVQPVTSANMPPLADAGHDIDLKVDVDRGHIDDFLRLANRAQTPLLTGDLEVKATVHIPAGSEPVYERMRLDGTFKLDEAHFTNEKFQNRIQDLSLRGQGRPRDLKSSDPSDITSEMDGEFHLANAVIALPEIHYNVPGAAIELKGKYALEGFMHFEGTARMQATVSQMVGGWKGWLLKPADRFFRKDGAGTEVPIEIRGFHDAPELSVDFNRMKHSSPETPGQKQ